MERSTANSSPTWKNTGLSRDCGSRTRTRTRPSAVSCSSGPWRPGLGLSGAPPPSSPDASAHPPPTVRPAPRALCCLLSPSPCVSVHTRVQVCVCVLVPLSGPSFLLSTCPRLSLPLCPVCLCLRPRLLLSLRGLTPPHPPSPCVPGSPARALPLPWAALLFGPLVWGLVYLLPTGPGSSSAAPHPEVRHLKLFGLGRSDVLDTRRQ